MDDALTAPALALLLLLGSNTRMLSTDKAWQKWGRDDPYFGVLADERFAAGRIEQTRIVLRIGRGLGYRNDRAI